MSKQDSFSREEVVTMLTQLFRELTESLHSASCSFEWEKSTQGLNLDEPQMGGLYSPLLGQAMSVLESSVDEKRISAAKTVLRQLFSSTRETSHSIHCDKLRNTILNESSGYGGEWEKIKNKLN